MPMKTLLYILLAGVLSTSFPLQAGTSSSTATLEELLDQYLKIKNTLVLSHSAQTLAGNFLNKAKDFPTPTLRGEQLKAWQANSEIIIKDLEGLASTGDIEKQRHYFSLLSVHFYPVVKRMEVKTHLYYQFCPMYNHNKGGYWISELSKIQNPYYGKKMLTCGSTKETIF